MFVAGYETKEEFIEAWKHGNKITFHHQDGMWLDVPPMNGTCLIEGWCDFGTNWFVEVTWINGEVVNMQ